MRACTVVDKNKSGGHNSGDTFRTARGPKASLCLKETQLGTISTCELFFSLRGEVHYYSLLVCKKWCYVASRVQSLERAKGAGARHLFVVPLPSHLGFT